MNRTRLSFTAFLTLVLLLAVIVPTSASTPGGALLPPASNPEASTNSTATSQDCVRNSVASLNNDYEQQVVYLTNVERQKVGAAPLKRNPDLDYAARYHARDLNNDNYFQHDSYDGTGDGLNGQTWVCAWNTRIGNYYSGVQAENIVAGTGMTPASAVATWMGSSGHQTNMLSTDRREIGLGYWSGSGKYGSYWVQDFGKTTSVYPLVINLEAAQTDSPQVSLYIYGSGTFTQMQLKNDNDAYGAWQTFQSSLTWNLKPTQGTHTVTVNLKDAAGNITTSSDTIYLTNGAVLGNLPSNVYFVYIQKEARWLANTVVLTPKNVGGTLALNWSQTRSQSWIQATPDSGTAPNTTLTLSVSGVDTSTVHTQSGTLTVTVSSPAGVANQIITVYVSVVANMDQKVFVPAVIR